MKTRTKTKSIIAAILIALLCFIAGLFFSPAQDKALEARAETVDHPTGTPSMIDGMSIQCNPDDPKIRLGINLTSSLIDLLSTETKIGQGWFDEDKPCEYYIGLRRINPKMSYEVAEQTTYFHVDPEYAEWTSLPLVFNRYREQAYLVLPMPSDMEVEYIYSCAIYKAYDVYSQYQHGIPVGRTLDLYSTVTGSVQRSVKNVAQAVLENELEVDTMTEQQIEFAQQLAGTYSSEEEFTLLFTYKHLLEHGRYDTKTEQYRLDSIYKNTPTIVYDAVLRIGGYENISNFNVKYVDAATSRVHLQAESYEYFYDKESNIGHLDIIYSEFKYKDFALLVIDNDYTNDSNLYRYLYTTDVSVDPATDIWCLTYNYALIASQLFASDSWIFQLKNENFVVSNNAADTVKVYVGDSYLKIYFSIENQDTLKDLSVSAVAEIVPDFQLVANIHYSTLRFEDGTIVDARETIEDEMMYSELLRYIYWDNFKQTLYYETVTEALEIPELNGQEYFIPSGLQCDLYKDVTADEFNVHISYDYNTLFKINEIYGEETLTSFVACTKNSLSYDVDDLRLRIKDGYRIQKVSANAAHVATKFDEANADDLTLTLKTSAHEKRIIPVDVTYTDVWNVNVAYLEPWIHEKDGTRAATPFAVQTVKTVQVKVGDYDFTKPLSIDDVKTLLKKDNMDLFFGGIAPDREVNVELTNVSTYKATVTYGLASLTTIDYDGNRSEIRIPMTSYADWCKAFGDDFSILFLNRQGRTYFDRSNDVAREKLYGLFSMAIFEEQVSDLNSVFKNVTGAGNIEVFQSREVKGSDTYAFFDNLRTKGPVLSTAGHIGMSFCELVNDENRIQYSHFFFLDGSAGVHDNYLSNGGATDKDDTDGATENFFQSVGGDISIWWDDVTSEFEATMKPVKIILYVTLGVAAVAAIAIGIWWIVKKIKESDGNG